MLCKGVERGVAILELAERPLVDDVGVACVIEETGRDPWLPTAVGEVRVRTQRCSDTYLEHEPATQVDTTD